MKTNKLKRIFSAFVVVLFSCVPFNALSATPKEIYQNTSKGVVFIFVSKGTKSGNAGTGSIIRNDGLIVTNAHIFSGENSSTLISDISVYLKPDRVTGNHKKDLKKGYK